MRCAKPVVLCGVVVEIWDLFHIQTLSSVRDTQINNNFKTVSTPDGMTVSIEEMETKRDMKCLINALGAENALV